MKTFICSTPYAFGGSCCHGNYRFAFAHSIMPARTQTKHR